MIGTQLFKIGDTVIITKDEEILLGTESLKATEEYTIDNFRESYMTRNRYIYELQPANQPKRKYPFCPHQSWLESNAILKND